MRSAADSAGKPDVSVVVPTRDRWTLLDATLTSALAQQGVNFEIIVIDDGSSSQPPPMPALTDPRVRLIRNAGPHGVARARNLGIDQARGQWIAFLDDDDVWAPRNCVSKSTPLRLAGPRSLTQPSHSSYVTSEE